MNAKSSPQSLSLAYVVRWLIRDERGNVSVFVALSMMTIIFFVALAVDLGMLTLEKDNLQNKTEAAVLSGVYALANNPPSSGGYPAKIVQAVNASYQANGEHFSGLILIPHLHVGFYDVGHNYADFTYGNFASAALGEVPAGEPINAVAVFGIPKSVDAIEIKPTGETTGRVRASAVAYFEPYGLVSLGHDPATAGIDFYSWNVMSIALDDMGVIHSNTNITYTGTPSPLKVSGLTSVSASGAITNIEGGMEGAPKVSLPPLGDKLDELKSLAESEGRLCTLNETDFPPTNPGRFDADGNEYRKSGPRYYFIPHDGDHGGATYYIQGGYGSFKRLYVKGGYPMPHARNFTLCSDADQAYTTTGGLPIRLGGEGTDVVYVYCRGNVGGPLNNNWFGALGNQQWDGIVFRVGGYFGIRPSDGQTHYMHKLRVIADGKIQIQGRFVPAATFTYNGNFNPPTLYFRTRLGMLTENK